MDKYIDFFLYDDGSIDINLKDNCDSWSNPEVEKELRNYEVFFDGVFPMMLETRKGINSLVVLGGEDDGHIWFHKDDFGQWERCFDCHWLKSLINVSEKTIDYIKLHPKHKKKDNNYVN